jgi:hypothetical protein
LLQRLQAPGAGRPERHPNLSILRFSRFPDPPDPADARRVAYGLRRGTARPWCDGFNRSPEKTTPVNGDEQAAADGGGRADAPVAARWRDMAAAAGDELSRRLEDVKSLRLRPRDRERLARRLRESLEGSLRVPEGRPEAVAEEVRKLRAARPGLTPVELAWARTRERARRAAAAGAATSMPAMIPGVGPALAALGLVADWKIVAEQQRDLALEVAAILEVPLADPTEEVRALFLASAGVAFGAARAGEAAAHAAARQVARRWMARLVPGLGAAVTGALNYASTLAVGRAAIARFAERAGVEVRGLAPEAVSPALPRLRQAVVAAVKTAELGDGAPPVFTREQREVLETLSVPEREELLDLAVVSACEGGGACEAEDDALRAVARELGFADEALEDARSDAARGARAAARRFRKVLSSVRRGGGSAARGAWRRARRLARGRRG